VFFFLLYIYPHCMHVIYARYFIIIDDIWDTSDWEKIKDAFPNNNLDSRILITTRVISLSWVCCFDSDDGLVHQMKPLNRTDSERLLLASAFGPSSVDDYDCQQPLCDEILIRCEGVPLFIIGMADLFKEQLLQQKDAEDQRTLAVYSSELEQGPQRLPKCIERALSLAYDDLPYESKLQSLCMTMFPSGYKFDNDRFFFFRWNEDNEVAMRFTIPHLADRNVITRVAGADCRHCPDEEEGCHCQWHVNHFMQQFLASKSAEMGFYFTASSLKKYLLLAGAGANNNRTQRRLILHHPDPNLPSLLQQIDLSQTRSLAVSGAVSGIPMDKFVNLVVLDLEGWENLKDDDLLQICRSKMYFLTYLSVRNTPTSKIPPEIKELWSLQTLDASCTQISDELPLQVFKLTSLKHLDLRGTRVRRISKLPNKQQIVGSRVPLFTLLVGGGGGGGGPMETAARVTPDVRHLQDLEMLATVDLTENPVSFLRALGDLKWLKVLKITWSFCHSTDGECRAALLSSIGRWSHLQSLTIHCGLGCSMEFLGTLSYPPEHLRKLKVTGGVFAGVLRWLSVPSHHLSFLQITICSITADDLKVLADLAQLHTLVLGLDFVPTEAVVIEDGGFPLLRKFFVNCPVPWLAFEIGALPNLAYLQLEFAATLPTQTRAPSGIANIHRITDIALCYGEHYANSPSVKIIVEAVRKQIVEHCNPIDLYINGIEQDDVQAPDDLTEDANVTQSRTGSGSQSPRE
jgi:hypothetical protein